MTPRIPFLCDPNCRIDYAPMESSVPRSWWHSEIQLPAISTVHAVLDRHGLVNRPRPRRYKAEGTALTRPPCNRTNCGALITKANARDRLAEDSNGSPMVGMRCRQNRQNWMARNKLVCARFQQAASQFRYTALLRVSQ
jgi:hypothetical protein